MRPEDLYCSPNVLAREYSRFRVSERLLLTGHSHQAWPDCGFEAQQQAWLDAAEFVDDKWSRAFEKAEEIQRGYARLLNDPNGDIALDQNTLELVVRFISAIPLRTRPRLVSTDGEFHTIRRLLDRLQEESGLEIIRVPANPVVSLSERLTQEVNDRTSAVLCSSVLYQSARIVPGLPQVAEACQKYGADFLVDTYHHLNVVPIDLKGLEQAYLVGGGYKYCQLGEGVCFLRLPPSCALRPITTGWFTEFDALATPTPGHVKYGRGGMRFIGATFDPTSYYRAATVFDFFRNRELTPEFLRTVSQHQIHLLAEKFDELDLNPLRIRRDRETPLKEIGGFLVLWSDRAGEICHRLKDEGVWADYRGNAIRFGPAPYLSDHQLLEAIDRLGKVVKAISSDAK